MTSSSNLKSSPRLHHKKLKSSFSAYLKSIQRLMTYSLNIILPYLFLIIILQCPSITLSSQSSQSLSASNSQSPNPFGVVLVRSPESTVAPKGDEVLFECELNLTPDKIKWRFRHVSSKWDFNGYKYLDGYNITNEDATSKLRIYVSPETLGEYQCVSWFGSSAIASVTAKLTLASISSDDDDNVADNNSGVGGGNRHTNNHYQRPEQTLRWRVSPKNSILIKCGNIDSNPVPVWSFHKNGIPIPRSEPQLPSGALILNSVTSKDSGVYSCSAMNSITGQEIQLPQKIDLTVEHTQRTAPHFLIEPLNKMSVHPGQTVILECPGVGNPPPKPVWSSPDVLNNMSNNRTTTLPYGLQITNVSPEDNGTYTCRLDNGISPVLVYTFRLEVLEKPIILRGPIATLTNESQSLELECVAKGTPRPEIYWMINGADTRKDNSIRQEDTRLIIRNVKKAHAGIVQCFAKNDAGESNESNLLQVNPLQIHGNGTTPLGFVPTKLSFDHTGKPSKSRRKHKLPNMMPPSRPNVTRLSDDMVMLRWFVPKNDGLQILFFKVQYRMLGDITKEIPRENWQTTNDDIRDTNRNVGIKNFTSSVSGLKADRFYRFRIIAVYSNNDNKEGPTSGKFFLQRGSALGPIKGNLPAPVLTKVEGISENAIVLYWTLDMNRSHSIDGFYAHYRSASSAAEYTKTTIDGMHTRHFKFDNLESNTAFEFKLQSFTASAASEFSSILTGKTLKPPTPPPQVTTTVNPASIPSKSNETYIPVIAILVGGVILILLLVIAACFCLKRRKNAQQEDEDNKPHIDHIQADSHIVPQHHKATHRMNGVMNITPNPLAHEGDKNRNVMELRFMPTTGPGHQMIGVGSGIGTGIDSTTPSPLGTATCVGLGLSIGTSVTGLPSSKINNNNSNNNHHQNHKHQQSPTPPPILPHHYQQPQSQQQQQSTLQQQLTHQQFLNLHSQMQSNGLPYHHNNHHHHPSPPSPSYIITPKSPKMLHKHSQLQSPPPPPQYQNNNEHYSNGQSSPIAANFDNNHHHRTLDRSQRNLTHHYSPSPVLTNFDTTMPCDSGVPSLRRTRRSPGHTKTNNNNTNGGIVVPGSPRIQRSPITVRAQPAVIKRSRLGSHTENMSSGSLNSIEV